jgi:hypothetical protein
MPLAAVRWNLRMVQSYTKSHDQLTASTQTSILGEVLGTANRNPFELRAVLQQRLLKSSELHGPDKHDLYMLPSPGPPPTL